MPEARVINDKFYSFGKPLDEKQFDVFKRSCPDGNTIIASLPPESFEEVRIQQIVAEQKRLEREAVEEKLRKIEEEKNRPSSKSLRILEKKRLQKEQELINVNEKPTIIENLILQNSVEKNVSNGSNFKAYSEEIVEPPKLGLVDKRIIEETKTVLKKRIEAKMNLDDELEMMSREMETKSQPSYQNINQNDAIPTEEILKMQILDVLKKDKNAPPAAQISAWKEQYGNNNVHITAFTDTDVYIYHHITRKQWRTIKEIMQKTDLSNMEEVEERLKEKVFASCVLYPLLKDNWIDTCKAGVVDSLYTMILLHSGFLDTNKAMMLTTQL